MQDLHRLMRDIVWKTTERIQSGVSKLLLLLLLSMPSRIIMAVAFNSSMCSWAETDRRAIDSVRELNEREASVCLS